MSAKRKFAERFHAMEMFRYCEQCGRCSSACPITGDNGFNIRRLVRYVELDLIEEIAASPMPWLCAACGRCEDACPNGIRILDITRTLRAIGPEACRRMETAETRRLAEGLSTRLPVDEKQSQQILKQGFSAASRMSWETVVGDYFLPAMERM